MSAVTDVRDLNSKACFRGYASSPSVFWWDISTMSYSSGWWQNPITPWESEASANTCLLLRGKLIPGDEIHGPGATYLFLKEQADISYCMSELTLCKKIFFFLSRRTAMWSFTVLLSASACCVTVNMKHWTSLPPAALKLLFLFTSRHWTAWWNLLAGHLWLS